VWRTTPAPRRGEAIRLCAEALRTHKDALGSLVALEMGKSKPEGDGEVQEMIDIGEFAVGLSRQLYGLTMHSERPGHRMYEQWHPIGLVGIISAFNFPVAVWAWNCVRRRGVRRHLDLEAVAEDAAVGDRRDEDLQRSAEEGRLPGHLLPVQRRRHRAGLELRRRQAHPADQLHRLDQGRPHRRRARRAAHGRSLLELGGNNAIIVDKRGAEARHPGDRVRRGRHRRPALHHHAPPVRARIDLRRRARQAGHRLQAGREEIGDPTIRRTSWGH
jgi:aldehyde dehydrogenase (NAD+)